MLKLRQIVRVGLCVFAAMLFAAPAWATDAFARLIPHAADTYGDEIDKLYYMIYWITIATFIGVQAALVYFLIKYRARPGQDGEVPKAKYSHGDHTLELIWTLTPAAMLLFIALVQRDTWMDIKTQFPDPQDPAVVKIEGRAKRFNWEWLYAGKDGKFDTKDDFVSPVLVVPVDHKILLQVRSKDVIHSFFLPHFRVKQDIVPGLTIPIWFKPIKTTEEYALEHGYPLVGERAFQYEVVCAELCGNSHFNMRGTLDVLERTAYDEWVASKHPSSAVQKDWVKRRKALEDAKKHVASKPKTYNFEIFQAKIDEANAGKAKEGRLSASKVLSAKELKPYQAYRKAQALIAEETEKGPFWGWQFTPEQKATKEFQ